MKGFPNQVADLPKLAKGMKALAALVDVGQNARDYGVFGEALVRAGVAGTGHTPRPVQEYISEQRTKAPDRQSFQTTARGLRELYRLLGFIDDAGNPIVITPLGRQAAAFADASMEAAQKAFWRRVINNVRHHGGDAEASHPYQVLLRLVARKPGITRGKCALALEARNDSPEELERIVALVDRSEEDIKREIHVSNSNWDNAKKVLPKFAEQLDDVYKIGQSFYIADAPGRGGDGGLPAEPAEPAPRAPRAPRPPRASRAVTPDTIGRAGTAEDFDDVEIPPPDIDPEAARRGIETRRDRLRRHNLLVRELAVRLTAGGASLHEDPMDVLAVLAEYGVLGEVKTLDGTPDDERDRVRDALGQLLYYEAFVTRPVAGETAIRKIACFERQITDDHQRFLNGSKIGTIYKDGDGFGGDELAIEFIGDILEELRR